MKPLLIYDGDCRFCSRWVLRSQKITGDKIDYSPFQQVGNQFPQISEFQFQQSIQLIDTDGAIYRGAEAAFRVLALSPHFQWPLWAYRYLPFFKPVSEFFYRLIAHNRKVFSKSGESCHMCEPRMAATRWIFVKAIGVIYLFAFVSLWTQVLPLMGREGILPAHEFLSAVSAQIGLEKFFLLPTLCWINASDLFLHFLCAGGTLLSICLIAGICPGPASFLLWLFYLSLTNVGRDFMSFQWDSLLLETGFLTIFLAPFKRFDLLAESKNPPKVVLFLLRFLLFRLMFFSGFAKLASGDTVWRDLSALLYHYETQPLPTWVAWYAHQLPAWFQKFSAIIMFLIELVVPFFIFAPRILRLWAYSFLVILQLIIIATGNYCFFNLLTIVLCLLLLDDQSLPVQFKNMPLGAPDLSKEKSILHQRRKLVIIMSVILLVTAVTQSVDRLFQRPRALSPLRFFSEIISPFHLVNHYGLFAVMTTKRDEIVLEGSQNGKVWLEYEFKFKPGDLKQYPQFNIPHQPRLDWQMWFAALGRFENNRWFMRFAEKILKDSKSVLALMKKNPFPDHPPRYLRAVLYEYHFTDFKTRKASGAWWVRESKGLYAPVMSLQSEGSSTRGDLP